MIVETKRAGLPLAMVNGRISERSFNRWRRAPRLDRARCSAVSTCASRAARPTASASSRSARRASRSRATSSSTRRRCRSTGASSPSFPGLTSGRQIWIAASTHAGEELIAARAHKRLAEVFPDALTLIAPAPSRAGRGDPARDRGRGPRLRVAVARRAAGPRDGGLRLRHDRRARPLLPARGRRLRRQVVRRRRRPEPDRAGAARLARSCTGRWSAISPTPTRRSTRRAARSRSHDPERLGEALIALFADARAAARDGARGGRHGRAPVRARSSAR